MRAQPSALRGKAVLDIDPTRVAVVERAVRLLCCLAAIWLYLSPLYWVLAYNVSLYVPENEFIGYRFYGSLAVLWHDPIPIVQGVPLGVLYRGVVWILVS